MMKKVRKSKVIKMVIIKMIIKTIIKTITITNKKMITKSKTLMIKTTKHKRTLSKSPLKSR